MAKLTITEALAEIKTINARVQKKHEAVMTYFSRDARLKDPLEKEGGAHEYVRRERQAISDLMARVVKIRTQIQRANLDTNLVIEGEAKNLAEWLTWRREIAPAYKQHLDAMRVRLNQIRTMTKQRGGVMVAQETGAPEEIVIHVSETDLMSESERLEKLLGALDGKLSLLNATILIDVD